MENTDNAIVAVVNANPVVVLTDNKTYSEFYQRMKAEVDAFEPDLTTKAGRDRIAALAYKVTRTKTAIDAAGKQLNEEARARINTVDAQRRKIREELESLAETARKPLTEWEEKEAARVTELKERIAGIHLLGDVTSPPLSWEGRLQALNEITFDGSFMEFEQEAKVAHANALDKVKAAYEAHLKAEADRIELERLRAEAAERARKDEEERAARAKAEAEAAAAARAEEERIAREKAEAERKAREEAELKRREEEAAERARQEEREKAERELKAAQERADALERAAAEEKRRAEEEAERLAREQAQREADKQHRSLCCGEAKDALMAIGCEADLASKVVLAILANEIPRVSLKF